MGYVNEDLEELEKFYNNMYNVYCKKMYDQARLLEKLGSLTETSLRNTDFATNNEAIIIDAAKQIQKILEDNEQELIKILKRIRNLIQEKKNLESRGGYSR